MKKVFLMLAILLTASVASAQIITEQDFAAVDMSGFDGYKLYEHTELYSDNLDEKNTKDNESVKPSKRQIADKILLKKHSWNMLKFKK